MTLFLLFARFLPVVAIAEVKSILKTSGDQYLDAIAVKEQAEREAKFGAAAGSLRGQVYDKDSK